MNETQAIAEQAVGYRTSDLTDDVLEMAHLVLIDNVGCAIRGTKEPLTQILGEELLGRSVHPHNLVPGACLTSVPHNQAMLFASAAHAIDFDDTLPPAQAAHTGSAVIGSLVALSPHITGTGEDFIAAIVAGFETAARVGQLVHPDHYLLGFHPTATVAVFGAAAAAGRVMGFTTNQMRQTLGLAATQAAGLKCVFGTMTKPFNAGQSAASGLLAARLVARGFTSTDKALEAEKGYLDMFLGLPEKERKIAPTSQFYIMENAFKLHAACHATHPMIEALQAIMKANEFGASDVESIKVDTSELGVKTASIGVPKTGLECKFSYSQVAAATMLGHDMAANETYADEILADKDINKLRSRVEVTTNKEHPFLTDVEVTLKTGTTLTESVDFRELMRDMKSVRQRLEAKFDSNVGPALGEDTAVKLRKLLFQVSTISSLKEAVYRHG